MLQVQDALLVSSLFYSIKWPDVGPFWGVDLLSDRGPGRSLFLLKLYPSITGDSSRFRTPALVFPLTGPLKAGIIRPPGVFIGEVY
jgi:hypothetical protein